jgi:chemotaxis protein MotA
MDLVAVFGLVVGVGGILLGNVLEGGHISSLVQFAAGVIVFTGTAGAVMLSNRKQDLLAGLAFAKKVFADDSSGKESEIRSEILECARIARKESLLAIESRIAKIKDPFLRDVMKSVVDGVDSSIVREIYENRIEIEEETQLSAAKVWNDAGGFAPTIGIIGAVLGLIHVMGNLSDTSKLGAGIAVAFVATVYGVGSANLLFLPLGNKIKKIIAHQMRLKRMILDGGLAIQAGLNPSEIDIKIKSFSDHA